MKFLSWAPEVLIGDTWSRNGQRFATEAEAATAAQQLLWRWTVPTDSRATRATDAITQVMNEDGTVVPFCGYTISTPEAVVGVWFFSDAIVARMLRQLCLTVEMNQAEFMTEYHRRCGRSPGKRSSLQCNFGRYLVGSSWGSHASVARVARVISQRRDAINYGHHKLTWAGPEVAAILHALSDAELDLSHQRMEAQMVAPRATDHVYGSGIGEAEQWLLLLSAEIELRSQALNRRAA